MKYAQNARVYGGNRPQSVPSGHWTPAQFGTAAEGAYEVSMFGSADAPILALYFTLGGFGALVAPLHAESRLITIRSSTQEEFRRRAQVIFGVQVDLGITYSS